MARPLITTDVPGCRAVVDRDITGFLREARNSQSLAEAMERFISLSAGARGSMGQPGHAKMEREYDQALVITAYREALADLSAFR